VFTGDLDGNVLAFDASDGRILWRASTGQPIGGGVVSYAVKAISTLPWHRGFRPR